MPLSHGHSAYEEHEDDVASKFSGKQLQCVTQMIFYSTYTYVEFGRYLSVTLAHEAAQLKHTSAFCRKMFDSRVYTVGKLVAHKAVIVLIALGIRKLVRIGKAKVLPQDLVEECANLKKQIIKMSAEKDRILGMRVSDIGNYEGEEEGEGEQEEYEGCYRSQVGCSCLEELE